jgi:hypothetical protein
MFRQIARLAILAALGLSGCNTSARYVTTTSACGVVAIPKNTNAWPDYYRKQAEELMQAKCPEGYVVEYEDEFIPGANKNKHRSDGSTESTWLFETTEYRIYYRRKDAPEGASIALLPLPPATATPSIARQPVGLTPVSTPLANTPGVNMQSPLVPTNRPGPVMPASY